MRVVCNSNLNCDLSIGEWFIQGKRLAAQVYHNFGCLIFRGFFVLFISIFLIVLYTTHVLIFVLFYIFIQLLQFRPDEIVMESKAIATGGGGQVCSWVGCEVCSWVGCDVC